MFSQIPILPKSEQKGLRNETSNDRAMITGSHTAVLPCTQLVRLLGLSPADPKGRNGFSLSSFRKWEAP